MFQNYEEKYYQLQADADYILVAISRYDVGYFIE